MKKHRGLLSAGISSMLLLNLFGSMPCPAVNAETEQTVMLGDVNSDGSFNSADAVMMQSYILGREAQGFTLGNADFDGNQRIDVFDVILLKKALIGYISENFYSEAGYITQEYTEVETEYITFKIDENIYVRNDLALHADRIYEAIETVTGMSFTDAPYGKRVVVNVSKPQDTESELSTGYAIGDEAYISSGDLLIDNDYAIIHEMIHTLEARYNPYYSGKTLSEGFAVYTNTLVLEYLEEHYPDTYAIGWSTIEHDMNHAVEEDIYDQSLEYWMENGYPHGNGLYGVGRMLLAYIHETKGDFTSWISARDEIGYIAGKWIENEDGTTSYEDGFTVDMQLELLKNVYGDDILDGCYDWLKENEADFMYQYDLSTWVTRDFTGIEQYDLYPSFYAGGNVINLLRKDIPVVYSNLTVNIGPTRFYLEKYKGYDASGIVLNVNEECQLALYDKDGNLLRECSGGDGISLEDVYKIKLVGDGTATKFTITNYTKEAS
ncbi:MAG: dockerin type I repeat-containing protein [Ruminococcus sp.]|nr:dockerin type I repeat-containing protein [Ruminococcus sp.]